MNSYFWLWILLGCVVTLAVLRLLNYLTRLHDPYPEEIFMFSQPLDWEDVKSTFNLQDARAEVIGRPSTVSQRMLHNRFAASQEYFKRMEHNAWLIGLCGGVERRATTKDSMAMAHEETLSEAQAMLEGAQRCEVDAELPEYENQAAELRARANGLRRQAQELVGRAEKIKYEDQARKSRISDAIFLAGRFRKKVRLQLVKLALLNLLLRIDKLRLLPAAQVIQLWHSRNDELLRLYQQARLKAAAYLSIYHADQKLLARM
jgi:hypothetical protein